MRRTTHTAEVEFDLDPYPGYMGKPLVIYVGAEQTYPGHQPDFTDPGAPPEYDIHTVQHWDYEAAKWFEISRAFWETLFGRGSWNDLLEFLEGELEEVE